MTVRHCTPAAIGFGTLKAAVCFSAIALLSGCAEWPRAGNNGLLYTNVTMPVAVLDPEAPNVRTGEACSTGFLGLYAAGDSSINAAKTKVGITKISMVEEHFKQFVFGAYSKYCTIVSGS